MGLVLDSKLMFNEHINHILSKVNKSIGLLRKFQSVLPRSSLLTVYKIFIRSHLDYADVVYRSSHRRCSVKKGSLGNFAKFTGTHLRQRLFFIKKEALAKLHFAKFLRTPFLTEHLQWLHLSISEYEEKISKRDLGQ